MSQVTIHTITKDDVNRYKSAKGSKEHNAMLTEWGEDKYLQVYEIVKRGLLQEHWNKHIWEDEEISSEMAGPYYQEDSDTGEMIEAYKY